MYKPAPARRKKTNICRSRLGCKGCRKKRRKCDEQKPSCGSCMKLGRPCEPVPLAFEFRNPWNPSNQSEKHSGSWATASKRNLTVVTDDSFQGSDIPGSPTQHRPTYLSKKVMDSSLSPPMDHDLSSDLLAQRDIDTYLDTAYEGYTSTDSLLDVRSCRKTLRLVTPRATCDMVAQLEQSGIEHICEMPQNMPPALEPHHDVGNALKFYMAVWRDQCLPALHMAFHRLASPCGQSSLTTEIMATLSACRLSRTLPQRRLFKIADTPGLCFRPDADHERLSGELYGSAMRKMAWWSHQDFDLDPIRGLAVLILFCYLEASMGNFEEFRLHSDGVEKLMKIYIGPVTSRGAGLLGAWVEVKMQNWWRRAFFSVPDFYQDCSVPLLCPELEAVLTTEDGRRASVLWVLCESHRLYASAVVACWENRKHSNQITKYVHTDTVQTTNYGSRPSTSDYLALMDAQSERLDKWYACLPISELPDCADSQRDQRDQSALNDLELGMKAIHFRSHRSAMNFAYYVAARVMQCSGPLQSLDCTSLDEIDEMYEESELWVTTLIRITMGIDWKECTRLNVYTIGLAGLLLACALRSRNLATGLWIQSWLEERLEGGGFEEGNFPVFQVLDALRCINQERSNGRDVFALFQTVNDGGGSGKFGSYHSQRISSLLLYGRCRLTAEMYEYSAPA